MNTWLELHDSRLDFIESVDEGVSLHLRQSGDPVVVHGNGVRVESLGSAEFLEDLPLEMLPRDAK